MSPTEAASSSRSTSSTGIALGSRAGVLRRADPARRVGVEHALQGEEPVQAAHGDQGAGGRRRRERGVLVIPLAQPGEELGDVRLADVLGALDADRGEVGGPAAQVAAVGRQGVREAPRSTSRWVSHASTARPTGVGRAVGSVGRWGQDSASSRVMLSMPNASATAA